MNLYKLKEAEAGFLQRFPLGFDDPEVEQIRKRHNVGQVEKFASTQLTRARFNQPDAICDDALRIVSRSSMVSRFEKPPFREFVASLNSNGKARFAGALEMRLYGRNKRAGFEEICDMLAPYKLAKWSVVSSIPFYFAPTREAFVKPTTAKRIVRYLEVTEIVYRPFPTWDFYDGYRKLLREVKANVSPHLAPNYAALTGFLMMSI
ncbi:MAG TPA: hypothetical protein VJ998_12145 [Pseudomonadales bacterium]|nr:hypothetical protein [Pseudomonadales bacterium]